MSSDRELWGSEDPDYLEALANASIPSQSPSKPPAATTTTKRKRSPTPPSDGEFGDAADSELFDVNPSLIAPPPKGSSAATKKEKLVPDAQNDEYVYGPATFGGFGEYMFRKRAKLQRQNETLIDDDEAERKEIFKGVAIYVRWASLGCGLGTRSG